MPCRYDESIEEREQRFVERDEEIDIITRVACTYCRMLEKQNKPVPSYARAWWRKHKKLDDARIAKELEEAEQERLKAEARKKASKALSKAERRALGMLF